MRPFPAFLVFCALAAAQDVPVYFSVPPADAPELARRGPWPVGVRTLDIVNPGQPDILNYKSDTGLAPLYDRPLKIEIWYPATIPAGREERTLYQSPMPRPAAVGQPQSFAIAGKALRDAPPASGERFPLVIVSHGYPGSRLFLTYLTENLASKGYVVAAIDHTDSVFGEIRGFQSTLLNRSRDQLFTIDAIAGLAQQSGHFLNAILDSSKAAIIGYSMGGYGALASAGAGYSSKSAAAKMVPGGYFDEWTADNPKFSARRHENLKAMVAIAPWGAQPPYSSWDEAGLTGIRIPSLFIAGDQDDVSDYAKGIKPAFDRTVNSERCLLVYENARHNVGGNPPPAEALSAFTTREFFDEPVWRKDRITAINQHFITAFLNLHLKGDETARSYLNVSPSKSNDGQWPLPQGQSAGSAFSKGEGGKYWKGFQRRWAVGLEMNCTAKP